MTTFPKCAAAAVCFAAIAAMAPRADAADVYVLVANGQSIVGRAPPGDPIRIQFPLSKGASPTLSFSLIGSPLTVSFRTLTLYGPDGKQVVFAQGADYFTIKPHSSAGGGRDGIGFKGWTATQSGYHEIVLTTNASVSLRAQGKLTIKRATKFPFQGDENSPAEVNPILVAMSGDPSTGIFEKASVVVKRVSGTAPMISHVASPSGLSLSPGQKRTPKGSTIKELDSLEFGDYAFTVGYQTATGAPAAGKWKGVVTIKPFRGGFAATLALRNPPGVALSVLDVDRQLTPSFGGKHVGVATDGSFVLVTSEGSGSLLGQFYDQDLNPPTPANVVTLASGADLPNGETLAGHRVIFAGNAFFAGASSTSGQTLILARYNGILQRSNLLTVVGNSTDPTTDFFLASDGLRVSAGVFHSATATHTVYGYDVANLGSPSTSTIGGAGFPQTQGAGAAWRGAPDSVFELWTDDTLDYRGPSKLHRVRYSSTWSPQTTDFSYSFADPSPTETMPSAVSIDPATGIMIVHYVVADNPPQAALGTGNIHRRLFDAGGVEVPGSHFVLPTRSCYRPTSALLGDRLYVAFETQTGPVVERFPLLRTK